MSSLSADNYTDPQWSLGGDSREELDLMLVRVGGSECAVGNLIILRILLVGWQVE